MNVLYFTLDDFDSLGGHHSINTDLLREFQKNGHMLYVISPCERKKGLPSRVIKESRVMILKPRIGNMQKTNTIERGFSTLTVGGILVSTIRKYLQGIRMDLVVYCTPPITFLDAISYVKKRDGAKTYLLLKDIFPQNAVDLGMMKENGMASLIYRYFRQKEKQLYRISDRIGCMSQANVDYVLEHNPEVDPSVVGICPNSIEVADGSVGRETRCQIRKKYDIPLEKTVFVYGGNLGKPQGIPFMLNCLDKCRALDDAFFLIVGDGTEFSMIDSYVCNRRQENVKLMRRLPKEDYDALVAACDVGLIFLDHRFTIPNFPSRMLSYMKAKLPVLACTDPNTDIGRVIEEGGFGWWVESDDAEKFFRCVEQVLSEDLTGKGDIGFRYEKAHYSAAVAYEAIMMGG